MRAIVYLRVSTDEQAASGLGIAAQLHACSVWATREGVEVIGPFEDEGVSGSTSLEHRPALLDAITELQPGDVLVVAKRDRLGRDPIVVAMIESTVGRKAGCRVVSAAGEGTDSDDPSSVLMRRMIDAFAEYERLLIIARTRAALAAKRRRGERTGQVPYGFDVIDDGRRSKKGNLPAALAVNTDEANVISEIKELSDAGLSLREIARHLDAKGIKPKSGKSRWSHTSIRLLIKRSA